MAAPPPPSPAVATARARLASLTRYQAEPERIDAARLQLRECVAEEYIRDLLAAAPPLTAEQRARLAALLTGT